MRKLFAALLLVLLGTQVHAQQLINCATNTACTNNGPANTGTGDNLPTAGTKINANFQTLPSELFNGQPLTQGHGGTGATSLAAADIPVQSGTITSGHCVQWLTATAIGDAGAACGGGGGSTTFQVNGVGLLSSSLVNFLNSTAAGGLTLTVTNASAGNIQLGLTGWPSLVNGDCLTNNGTSLSWGSCGSGSGAFSGLSGGTNTTAAMLVGTGASLGPTGSGTVNANQVNGAIVPASASVLASNSSNQLTSAAVTGSGSVVLATSPTLATPALGAATATSINGNTFTSGTYTLTGGAGKTLNFTNSLTLSGSDATTMTFPGTSGTVDTLNSTATYTAPKTFTNSDLLLLGSSTGATTFTSANAGATAYTATVPANTGTLAETNLSQTWTGTQTFNGTLAGTAFGSPPAIGGTAPAAGSFTTLSATGNLTTNVTGATQCLHVNLSGVVSGTGSDCGTSGGSSAFNALTSGTNTSAAMLVGTGASLGVTGSGTISASNTTGVNGATVPASAAVLASNVSSQIVSATTTGSGNVVLATSPALTTPNLGTPSAATLTNATGLPISTGVSGLGTGIASFLATPSSANLAAAVTDETGSGVLVFGTSPTLTTPNLGTPSAVNLSNATALPLSALANQGTTTTVLHGNAAGNPSFGAVSLTADVSGTLPGGNGGTGNAFFAVSGPATSSKTFTFPNASATVLTSNAAVTVAQGGTGLAALTAHDLLIGAGTSNATLLAPSATSGVPLISQGATSDPAYGAVNLAGGSSIVSGTLPVGNGGTGGTSLSGAGITTFTGTITSGHCAQFSNTTGQVSDSGAACGGGGGSGTVNSGTSGQLAYYGATGTAVSGLTVGNGLTISSGAIAPTYGIDAQTGTSYTISCTTDASKLVTFSNAAAVAVTLPQATSSCGAGFSFDTQNKGAGAVTITPTTSTINGASTLVIPQNMGCSITSDGTNYQVAACSAALPATNLAGSGTGGVTGNLGVSHLNSGTSASSTTYWRGDGTWATPAGSGTVTSVGLTMPTGFTVTGSPVTGSGTLAVTTSLSGVLKGTGSAFTTAAAADIYGLWSGTCSATTFLRGDGSCQTPAGGGNVSTSGTPSAGQIAVWASSTTAQGQNNLPIGVNAATSATSVTPNCTFDVVTVTASATGTFTINAPGTCTPVNGQRLRLEVLSPSGGAVTYSFNAAYKASASLALPTTSNAASKEDDFEFEYSSRLTGWKFMAVNQGF